ncbi:MAG: PH domain-containing protein [Bacilli bacterium]|nr:PH domain-containing protein [Bacilli bacterium]
MAYIKYKELTKYFNFNKEINKNELPSYVTDYLYDNELVFKAYKTHRDKGIFTNSRMILFDVNPLNGSKKIHVIPYKSISSGAILFKRLSGSIYFSFDSGYQIKLNFVGLNNLEKTEIRKLFYEIMKNVK